MYVYVTRNIICCNTGLDWHVSNENFPVDLDHNNSVPWNVFITLYKIFGIFFYLGTIQLNLHNNLKYFINIFDCKTNNKQYEIINNNCLTLSKCMI